MPWWRRRARVAKAEFEGSLGQAQDRIEELESEIRRLRSDLDISRFDKDAMVARVEFLEGALASNLKWMDQMNFTLGVKAARGESVIS